MEHEPAQALRAGGAANIPLVGVPWGGGLRTELAEATVGADSDAVIDTIGSIEGPRESIDLTPWTERPGSG